MISRSKIGFICILLMVTGCTAKPVFTVEIYQSPTPVQTTTNVPMEIPIPAPTLLPVPTFTPILDAPPTTTSAKAFMLPDFSPVLYGKKYDTNTFFILLGGVQGSTWLTPELAAAQFSGAWDYDVYTLTKKSFSVRGQSPQFSPTAHSYFVGTDVNIEESGMVGVLQGWPVQQGDIQELTPESDLYRQTVLDWLKSEGIAAPEMGTLRVFRVDLEADGVDEIFISATHLESEQTAKAGDYSIILMRRVRGNKAVTVPIVADVYRSQTGELTFPRTYSVANFIDLNHDGTLEVIIGYDLWEGTGAFVYQFDGQKFVQVLGQ